MTQPISPTPTTPTGVVGHGFGTRVSELTGLSWAACPCGHTGPARRAPKTAARDSRMHVYMATVGGLYTAETAATVQRLSGPR